MANNLVAPIPVYDPNAGPSHHGHLPSTPRPPPRPGGPYKALSVFLAVALVCVLGAAAYLALEAFDLEPEAATNGTEIVYIVQAHHEQEKQWAFVDHLMKGADNQTDPCDDFYEHMCGRFPTLEEYDPQIALSVSVYEPLLGLRGGEPSEPLHAGLLRRMRDQCVALARAPPGDSAALHQALEELWEQHRYNLTKDTLTSLLGGLWEVSEAWGLGDGLPLRYALEMETEGGRFGSWKARVETGFDAQASIFYIRRVAQQRFNSSLSDVDWLYAELLYVYAWSWPLATTETLNEGWREARREFLPFLLALALFAFARDGRSRIESRLSDLRALHNWLGRNPSQPLAASDIEMRGLLMVAAVLREGETKVGLRPTNRGGLFDHPVQFADAQTPEAAEVLEAWLSCPWQPFATGLHLKLLIEGLDGERERRERAFLVSMAAHVRRGLAAVLRHSPVFHGRRGTDSAGIAKALRKLRSIEFTPAYLDWMLDEAVFEETFSLPWVWGLLGQPPTSQAKFLASSRHMLNFSLGWGRSRAQQYSHALPWPLNLRNAFFVPDRADSAAKEVALLWGLWQEPIFSLAYPSAVNYGTVGAILGHEFAHAFDSRQSLGMGFSNRCSGDECVLAKHESLEAFDRAQQLMTADYERFAGEHMGEAEAYAGMSEAENTADFAGLRAALDAVDKLALATVDHPSLGPLSPRKLFFQSWARFWCSAPEKQQTSWFFIHAPQKARVNVPLRNLAAFAEAFDCPKDSPMNPTKKLRVW